MMSFPTKYHIFVVLKDEHPTTFFFCSFTFSTMIENMSMIWEAAKTYYYVTKVDITTCLRIFLVLHISYTFFIYFL